MKTSLYISLLANSYSGQLRMHLNPKRVVYTEYPERENAAEIDVLPLITEMEANHKTVSEILTACSDYLYERTCVDCNGVGPDILEPTESERACYADVQGDRLCDDCCYSRYDEQEYQQDPYAYFGVSRSDFI